MSIFEINYSNLGLATNWFLFISFLLLMIIFAIFIPRFLVNFLKKMHLGGDFLAIFLLAIITSLPETFTLISFTVLDNVSDNGDQFVKAFANIIGSNWFSSLAFAGLFFYNSFILKHFFTEKPLHYSSLFVFLINCFLLLVILFPHSFLNYTFPKFQFFSFFFILVYLFFNFWFFYQHHNQNKIANREEFDINLFTYYYSPFLVLPLLIFLIVMLVFAILFLVPLSAYLQSQHNFSNQSIGGLFFAFATSSTEIWSCLSLWTAGLSYLGAGIIIESHLFNLFLYICFAFFNPRDIYMQLHNNINFWTLLPLLLWSFTIFFYTFLFSQKNRLLSAFLAISIIVFSFFGLIKLG